MNDDRHADSGTYKDVPRFASVSQATDANEDLIALCGRVLKVERVPFAPGGHRLLIQDLAGNEQIYTLAFRRNPALLDACYQAVKFGQTVLCYGSFVELDAKDEGYEGPGARLLLRDLRRITNPTSMLAPARDELAEANAVLDGLLQRQGGLRDFLLREVRGLCGVQAEFLSPRFQLAEEAMLVQALSRGQVPRELNSRLSVYLFSAPGTGKNLLGEYARLLAPISERVQPALVSPAGFSASVMLGRDGFYARPGVLPMTSGGVCVLDDLHRLERRNLNSMQGILMTTLEEGCVKPVKAGSATYEARCGVVLTSNRVSLRDGRMVLALRQGGPQARAADLVLPFDLFSRTDLVFNLDSGDDAIRTAMRMASQPPCSEFSAEDDENTPTRPGKSEREVAIRRLKLLVALVGERIAVVDTAPIEEEIEETMLKMGVVIREYTALAQGLDEESSDGDAFVRRMSVSLRKLIGGLARLDGRAVANKDDLVRAWRLLTPKLEVVRWLCGTDDRVRPLPDPEEQVRRAMLASDERWAQVVERFGGQEVRIEGIVALLGCTEQTARRELGKRGIAGVGGAYPIPTAAQWARDPRSRRTLQSELLVPASEMEDEAAAPEEERMPTEFDDGLPALPAAAQEIVEEVRAVPGAGTEIGLMVLLMVVCQPERFMAKGVVSTRLRLWSKDEGVALRDDPVRELSRFVDDEDWGVRAARGVALCAALLFGDEGVSVRRIVGEAAAVSPLPEAAQAAVAALLARLEAQEAYHNRRAAAYRQKQDAARQAAEQAAYDARPAELLGM